MLEYSKDDINIMEYGVENSQSWNSKTLSSTKGYFEIFDILIKFVPENISNNFIRNVNCFYNHTKKEKFGIVYCFKNTDKLMKEW